MTKPRQRVVHYYARYLEHPSGVTDSLNHWAEASVAAGDDVTILAAEPNGADRNEFALLGLMRTIDHLGRGRSSWIPTGLHRELKKDDLLILHEGWVLSNIYAGVVARLKGAKVTIIPHGVYEKPIIRQIRDIFGIRALLEKWALRRADVVHVFYEGEQRVVRQFEPMVQAFLTVPNGTSRISKDAEWTGSGDYFLWIGRFDVFHKGLDNLLNFWSRLPQPRPKLLMVGPDYEGGRQLTADLLKRLDLHDSVELRGRVTGREKNLLLANCRAYLHPSRWESCSIMLLEATAAGVPCLISSSIHAASALEPQGVLKSTDFEDVAVDGPAQLNEVDGNVPLGIRAREWADQESSWAGVGAAMVRSQFNLGLRSTV